MWTEVTGAGEHVSDGLSGPVPLTGPEQDPSPPTQTAHLFHLTSSPLGSVMSGGVCGRSPPGEAAQSREPDESYNTWTVAVEMRKC